MTENSLVNDDVEDMPDEKSAAGRWRIPALAGAVAFLAVLAWLLLPVVDLTRRFLEWTDALGPWGPAAMILAYIISCIFLIPGSILTVGAGFLFGLVEGTIVISIGATLGACVAFWVGRTLARDWVAKKVRNNRTFSAIDRAVGGQDFKIVFLSRLSPLFPFNLLNYAFGLTKARFATYALASWIGMLPGTIMYVYFGAAAGSLATLEEAGEQGGAAQRIFFYVGLVATVAVAVYVTRLARRELARHIESEA